MANALMALSVANPQINTMGAFAQGQQHAMDQKTQQLEHAKQNFSYLAQMAHDAQGDPAAWDAGLEALSAAGWQVDQFRGRHDLAPILAKSALTAEQELSNNYNQQQLDISRRRLAHDMSNAAKAPPPTAAQQNWDWAGDDPAKRAYLGIGQQTGARPITPDERGAWGIPETDTRPYSIEPGKAPSLVGGASQSSSIPMNSTIQKEIFEADEMVQSGQSVVSSLQRALDLNDTAFDGPFAEQRAYGAALFGNEGGKATLELKNEVTAQALDQLKAIFGGMPTEGERKILLDIQGSADQPRAVREAIYNRAIEAANRRIEANRAKGSGLRDGSYFNSDFSIGGSAGRAPAGGNAGSGWEVIGVEE